jgi:hypothetical protein
LRAWGPTGREKLLLSGELVRSVSSNAEKREKEKGETHIASKLTIKSFVPQSSSKTSTTFGSLVASRKG